MKRAPLCFLFAMVACGLRAEDLSAVLHKVEVPVKKAPSETLLSAEDGRVELIVDPVKQNRQFEAGTESAEQQVRVASQYRLTEAWLLTHETGGGIQQTDPLPPSAEGPVLQQQVTAFHRAGLSWRMAKALTVSGGARTGMTVKQGEAGQSQATRYEMSATLKPSEQTNVSAGYARQQTFGFDESMVMQDVYSAALGHKMSWVPVTLRSAASYAVEEGGAARDTVAREVSAVWAAGPGVELGAGLDARAIGMPDGEGDVESFAYFTQVTLQPATGLKLNARAVFSEQTTTAPVETTRERLTLQVGASVRLQKSLEAGVTVKSPIVDSAPEGGSMLPYVTFSATAAF